jgi:RNA polymerase sigma factor (sigma-70 family)
MTDGPERPEDPHAQEAPRRGADDARLVLSLRAGDADAFGRLYDRWFDRVHDLASRILWNADAAADVAQDTFVSAWRNLGQLEDPYAFGGWLLRIARNTALNRKRTEQRSRPVDETTLTVIERVQARPEDRIGTLDDPARVAEDASLAALLWDAAGALGERDRDVLDLQLRHGLAPGEIAEVVGLNRNAANQLVHRVRQRLASAVGARVLWRDGTPTCAALRAELVASEVDAFDADAVRITDRHANACAECDAKRSSHLSPATMFAAIPIMSLPALKARVAAALDAEGVPMQGSTAEAFVAPEEGGPTRFGRARRVALAVGVAVVVLVGVVALNAARLDDDPTVLVSESVPDDPTTTTLAPTLPTSPIAPPTTVAAVAPVPPPPTVRPTVPTTPAAVATTTTAPAAPTIAFAIAPAQRPRSYPMTTLDAPHLTWSVSGAAAVTVTGPASFSAVTLHDDRLVCPAPTSTMQCTAPPGAYNYTLRAMNSAGQVTGVRVVTLTIT